MAAKKKSAPEQCWGKAPTDLKDHPFYGLELTDEQKHFRDAIWDKDKYIVLCDSCAGSGKTTVAIATACLLYKYGVVDECFYIRTNSSDRLGFLPGDLSLKEKPYMRPLYNTMIKLGYNPFTDIDDGTMESQKMGTAFFKTFTDTYILGDDWNNKAVIIDEAQCMTTDALRAILTRPNDNCHVIVCGSSLQIQGIPDEKSGFAHCIEHFKDRPWAEVCNLTKNFRGELSSWADKL